MSNTLRIRTKMSHQEVSLIYHQGQLVTFMIRGGKIVFAKDPLPYPQTLIRMVEDIEGNWMEVGFLSDTALYGNPADGWVDVGNYAALWMQNSFDLVAWHDGNWIAAPSGGVVDNLDGTFWYWSRCTVPQYWKNLLIDNRLGSNRQGKSITNIKLAETTVTLPGYPYAMPAQAATLQADLIAAGYAGCTVQTSTADISVEITNYYYANSISNRDKLNPVVNAASQVTEVTTVDDVSIPLPSYPYQMPAAQATLQTDLRAAGYSGAVVKLYDDPWEIFIPDRNTTTQNSRAIQLTITPADPYPYWTMQGVYQGLDQDDTITGTHENIRSAGGQDLVEAAKQFGRLRLVAGTRYATPTA